MVQAWPKLKETTIDCHIRKLTTNDPTRRHYNAGLQDDVLYRMPSGDFCLYRRGEHPAPVYQRDAASDVGPEEPEETEVHEFAYESDLCSFLARNLDLLEPGLRLYEEEGVNGIEFPAGGKRIDILAQDANGLYVVIELKVSRGHERAVGQLAYYLSWVSENLAEGDDVRGIIVARKPSHELTMAARVLPRVEVFSYELQVELRKEQ